MNDSFHPYILEEHKDIYSLPIEKQKNIIFYGPTGVGKYHQSIELVRQYSASKLKYNKKMFIEDEEYYIRLSDIHFEIDILSLGCNYKTLFDKIQKQIKNSMESTKLKRAFIICKNFHTINKDLIHNFKNIMLDNCIYILNTEHVCFFPNDLIELFHIVSLKEIKKKFLKGRLKKYTNNLNIVNYKINDEIHDISYLNKKYSETIINYMENNTISYMNLREHIYNLLTFQCNIEECIWIIFKHFSRDIENISDVIVEIYNFFKCYNNNYRPIFHLERIILYIYSQRKNISPMMFP